MNGRLLVALLLTALGPVQIPMLALLAAPSPEMLVRDLGAGDYATRERASVALRQLGAAALPALEQVEHSADPEVRERAREILADLRLGITPDWPEELATLARGYRQLDAAARPDVLQRLAKELKLQAVPFLLAARAGTERDTVDRLLRDMAEAGIQEMRRALKRNEPAAVLKLAEQYRPLGVTDPRLLYLEAEGLETAGQKAAAEACRQRAANCAPDREEPHYLAAEMLQELRRDQLAAAEWNQILKIPPDGDVYDINAYLRLADLKSKVGQYAGAADLLEKALTLFRKARESGRGGYGLVGGDEKQIEARVRALRQKAKGEDTLPVEVRGQVKGDRPRLDDALKNTVATVAIHVEPHGLRLFDLQEAGLAYDPKTQTLCATLNGQRCSAPVKAALEQPARIAVRQLDCFYIFKVDPQTGQTEKEARFELDYVLRLKAEALPKGWTDLTVQVNDKAYEWAAAQKGIPFDFLPEKLTVIVRGTDADGQPQTLRLQGSVDDADVSRGE
jgi:tetratricopeptide (TPR) repeat protein